MYQQQQQQQQQQHNRKTKYQNLKTNQIDRQEIG